MDPRAPRPSLRTLLRGDEDPPPQPPRVTSNAASEYAALLASRASFPYNSFPPPPFAHHQSRLQLLQPALQRSLLQYQSPLYAASSTSPFAMSGICPAELAAAASHHRSVLTSNLLAAAAAARTHAASGNAPTYTDQVVSDTALNMPVQHRRRLQESSPNNSSATTGKRSVEGEKEENLTTNREDQMHGPVKKRRTDPLANATDTKKLNARTQQAKNDNSARSRFKKRVAAMAVKKEYSSTSSINPQASDDEPQTKRSHFRPKSSSAEEQWNAMYQRLVAYKAAHGDCLVPQRCESDSKLGKWVCYQRKRRTNLSQERRRRLEEIGFVFCVRQLESWDAMFDQLVEYKQKHGDCLVPQTYKENPKLGKWVAIQRIYKASLTKERQARMEKLGFVWSVNQALWETMYESLVEYKARNGNCRVPWNYSPDPQLANWVQRQRKNKKRLTRNRLERLQDIGLELS